MLIQTALPDNSTILHASSHDYQAFFEEEIAIRKMFAYPPFIHLIKVLFSGLDQKRVENCAQNFHQSLQKALAYEILPIAPAGYAKVKDRHRMQFLIKASQIYEAVKAFHYTLQHTDNKDVKIQIDVDPSSTYF